MPNRRTYDKIGDFTRTVEDGITVSVTTPDGRTYTNTDWLANRATKRTALFGTVAIAAGVGLLVLVLTKKPTKKANA